MGKLISLEEVQKGSIVAILYFFGVIFALYIILGFNGVIKVLPIQNWINIIILLLIILFTYLFKRNKISYRFIAWTGVIVGLLDFFFITIYNHYNELRLVWFFILLPFAYLYAGRSAGVFVSVVTFLFFLITREELGYSQQAQLTFVINFISLSLMLYFFIRRFELLSNLVYKSQLMLNEAAKKDYLTGVLNRRGLFEAIANDDRGVIALFDLDDFKKINDKYGHNAGDQYLLCLVRLLKKNTRKSDFIARIGGDEFVVFFPKVGLEQIEQWKERFYKKIESAECQLDGKKIPIKVSVGLSEYCGEIKKALDEADVMLYRVKEERKRSLKR